MSKVTIRLAEIAFIVVAATLCYITLSNKENVSIDYKRFEKDEYTVSSDEEYGMFYGLNEPYTNNNENNNELSSDMTSLDIVDTSIDEQLAKEYTVEGESDVIYNGNRFVGLFSSAKGVSDYSLYNEDELVRFVLKTYITEDSTIYVSHNIDYSEEELDELVKSSPDFIYETLDSQLSGDALYDSLKSEHGEKVKWSITVASSKQSSVIYGCTKYVMILGTDGKVSNVTIDISDIKKSGGDVNE